MPNTASGAIIRVHQVTDDGNRLNDEIKYQIAEELTQRLKAS